MTVTGSLSETVSSLLCLAHHICHHSLLVYSPLSHSRWPVTPWHSWDPNGECHILALQEKALFYPSWQGSSSFPLISFIDEKITPLPGSPFLFWTILIIWNLSPSNIDLVALVHILQKNRLGLKAIFTRQTFSISVTQCPSSPCSQNWFLDPSPFWPLNSLQLVKISQNYNISSQLLL